MSAHRSSTARVTGSCKDDEPLLREPCLAFPTDRAFRALLCRLQTVISAAFRANLISHQPGIPHISTLCPFPSFVVLPYSWYYPSLAITYHVSIILLITILNTAQCLQHDLNPRLHPQTQAPYLHGPPLPPPRCIAHHATKSRLSTAPPMLSQNSPKPFPHCAILSSKYVFPFAFFFAIMPF